MFEAISQAVQFTDNLIKTYPTIFHALVPIGTIGSLFIGYRNTTHIKTQASIQREIEQNRYNLQLFEHRKTAYSNFKSIKEDFFIIVDKDSSINIEDEKSISSLIEVTIDPLFLFTDSDNTSLVEFSKRLSSFHYSCLKLRNLNEMKESYIQYCCIKNGEIYDTSLRKEKINIYLNEIENTFDLSVRGIKELPILYHNADEYMKSKLVVPKQAFTPPSPSFVKNQIEDFKTYFQGSSKSERLLMFLVFLICITFGGVLWFLKLHPEIN